MKKSIVLTILCVILCALIFIQAGCNSPQPGRTEAEVRRTHIRNTRLNHQELMADIDKTLLTEEPSKLTDKRIP